MYVSHHPNNNNNNSDAASAAPTTTTATAALLLAFFMDIRFSFAYIRQHLFFDQHHYNLCARP